jgi:hypothetical protein
LQFAQFGATTLNSMVTTSPDPVLCSDIRQVLGLLSIPSTVPWFCILRDVSIFATTISLVSYVIVFTFSNTFNKLLKGSATIVAESGDAFPDLIWSSQADILKDLLPDSACVLFPTSACKGKSLDFPAAWAAMVNLLKAGFLAGYITPTGPNFTIKLSP